jgi:Flp pilus assembly protein TadG
MMFRNFFSFLKDRRGSIVPMFALSLIPTVGLVGAAVDYTRANSVRTVLQSSLDATTLAMAQSASSLTSDDLKVKATNYFNALYTKSGRPAVTLHVDYTTDNGPQLFLKGDTSVTPQFINIAGYNSNIPISASSTAAWGNKRLRVALALDNTGSMAANSKMTMLKTAAKNLIDQLSAAAKSPEDVYVSIVPFSKDVNIGTDLIASSSYVRWTGGTNPDGTAATDGWDDHNGTCSKGGASNKASCQGLGTCSVSTNTTHSSCTSGGCSISTYTSQNTCTSNGVCSKQKYTTQNTCSPSYTWTWGVWSPPGTWTAATWTPDNHSTWNGCIMDRDQSHDIDNVAPTDVATRFPAEQFSSCPVQLMPLSNNWSSLKTKIDSMNPVGNTNTTIGLEWGWHSLTQGSPLNAPPEDSHYTYQKVIIFLTDGDNTQNRFTGVQTDIDARMTAACANAKNPASVNGGVEIYTILVLQGSASLLQNCSSNASDHFFNITASNQLVSVFNQIGTKLARLHVAK